MKFKKLIWQDNITESGKANGLIGYISDFNVLDLHYIIRNYKYYQNEVGDNKLYFIEENSMPVECDSIEHGKQLAQAHFENVVKSLFYE